MVLKPDFKKFPLFYGLPENKWKSGREN